MEANKLSIFLLLVSSLLSQQSSAFSVNHALTNSGGRSKLHILRDPVQASQYNHISRILTSPCIFGNTPTTPSLTSTISPKTLLFNNRYNSNWNEEDELRIRQKAAEKGGGAGETATGAILGGLVAGPFGALFGAQLGASFGSSRAIDRERKAEMERLGITSEMLEMAQECGAALDRANEGLKAIMESIETKQNIARRLDQDVERLYEEAKAAITAGNEEKAGEILMERNRLNEKLKTVLKGCAEERKRLEKMEKNVDALEERAMEVDTLLRRSVGAKALQDTSAQLSLQDDDPLLRKFRDLERDK